MELALLRAKQNELRPQIYKAISRNEEAARVRLVAEYDALCDQLEKILGTEAHCNEVDPDLFGFYSDLYKDDHGFRPLHHITRAEVKQWLARRSS